ncbi:hypothetical protein [Micromonospora sp. NPDC047187]|uniref:hypothetical protein n=1 Tax=Micromonospora sp. NPDC047187 TaxID=3155262 RepID=UPI003406B355
MEWRNRWHITIRWDRGGNRPSGVTVIERVVDSPAELRYLVDRARADPHVVAYPYRQIRELVGEKPEVCEEGHPYAGGSATRPVRGWQPCSCGGHLVLRCRLCPDVRTDTATDVDCDVWPR